MKLNFFKRSESEAVPEAELERETVVVRGDGRFAAVWRAAWDRSHKEQQGESDGGVLCPQGGGGGGGGDLTRMRIAGEVTDRLFEIYGRTEAGITEADANLGPQKVFLLKLFRPLIMTLSYHGTALLTESDFVEPDRRKLTFDPVGHVAWPAPSLWVWREAERTICGQLSHNSKTLPVLVGDILKIMRTEYALALDAAPELSKYLALRTETEMAGKTAEYQSYEPAYYITKYFQISVETEAKQIDGQQADAEQLSFCGRLSVIADMRRYPLAVVKRGRRSWRIEQRITAELRQWAPEFLPTWRAKLDSIGKDYPAPSGAVTTTETGGGED